MIYIICYNILRDISKYQLKEMISMRKLTDYEKEILKLLESKLSFKEKIFLKIFPKISFKIFQEGTRKKIIK